MRKNGCLLAFRTPCNAAQQKSSSSTYNGTAHRVKKGRTAKTLVSVNADEGTAPCGGEGIISRGGQNETPAIASRGIAEAEERGNVAPPPRHASAKSRCFCTCTINRPMGQMAVKRFAPLMGPIVLISYKIMF